MRSEDKLDFSRRISPSQLPELMDGECSYAEFRDCLRDIEQVNHWLLGYRPTLHWLEKAWSSFGQRPHILDAGSGHGDLLRRIERWAQQRRLPVLLTGIDLNPYAAQAAAEATASDSHIRWITGDALYYVPDVPVDAIVSSLMTHHLEDEEVVTLLQWMESTARTGWFISDLERSENSYHAFRWLAKLVRWHPFVQHDGPVSIRRAFRREDWEILLERAGIPRSEVTIEQWRPGKLCVGRIR
jgi:SAM-dependent methyltransferase